MTITETNQTTPLEKLTREMGGWAASQLDACVRCGVCAAACPFYRVTGNPEYSPVWKMDLLRRAYNQRQTIGGRLKVALHLEKPIGQADLEHWRDLNYAACATCNRCSIACPMGIAVGGILHQVRDGLAAAGALPENLVRMEKTVQRDMNVFGFPSEERAGWVEYMMDAPDDLYLRDQAEVVYFVGCVSSFSPRAQRIAESFAKVMDAAGVNFTIMGGDEACCGFPLRSAGMLEKAEALIEANVEAVRARGAKTIVFTCPACRLMWLEEYSPRLPGVRILHSTQVLAELIAEKRLQLDKFEHTATYHDPCDLARTGGVYEAPRQVLNSIPGIKLLEVSERRDNGLCCGGGGDVEMVSPQLVKKVAIDTVAKLVEPGAEVLATACPQCTRVLEEGLKTVKPEMKTLDLVEIVARSAGLS